MLDLSNNDVGDAREDLRDVAKGNRIVRLVLYFVVFVRTTSEGIAACVGILM
jgi:hypothetical protein